jgi:hypothetical protein
MPLLQSKSAASIHKSQFWQLPVAGQGRVSAEQSEGSLDAHRGCRKMFKRSTPNPCYGESTKSGDVPSKDGEMCPFA